MLSLSFLTALPPHNALASRQSNLHTSTFYFGDATRSSAEVLLRNEPLHVAIVRPSTQSGALSVSWREPDRIKHSLIEIKG